MRKGRDRPYVIGVNGMSGIRPALVTLLILMTSATLGCRSLPEDFERSETTKALAPATEGPLAEFAAASDARFGPDKSGFILLDRNDEDFNWRLALVDSARQSLDLRPSYGAATSAGNS